MFTNVHRRLICVTMILVFCPILVSAQWIDEERVSASASVPFWLYPVKNPNTTPLEVAPLNAIRINELTKSIPNITYSTDTGNMIDFGTIRFKLSSKSVLGLDLSGLLCLDLNLDLGVNDNLVSLVFPDLLYLNNLTVPGTTIAVTQKNITGNLKLIPPDVSVSQSRYVVGFSLDLSNFSKKILLVRLFCVPSGGQTLTGSFDLDVGGLLYPFTWKVRFEKQ